MFWWGWRQQLMHGGGDWRHVLTNLCGNLYKDWVRCVGDVQLMSSSMCSEQCAPEILRWDFWDSENLEDLKNWQFWIPRLRESKIPRNPRSRGPTISLAWPVQCFLRFVAPFCECCCWHHFGKCYMLKCSNKCGSTGVGNHGGLLKPLRGLWDFWTLALGWATGDSSRRREMFCLFGAVLWFARTQPQS